MYLYYSIPINYDKKDGFSFCNQPKAHYLATPRETRRYVADFSRSADAGIWLRPLHLTPQESKRV